MALRSLLRYLDVNSGDMQKGVMRVEPNVSVRPVGSIKLGTRVEIKNLNSFRSLERSVDYEIQRQIELLNQGKTIQQETMGWDVANEVTLTQRVKEGEEDYRYFPDPDLPPLVLELEWIEKIRCSLPELPVVKQRRFEAQYELNPYDAGVLVFEPSAARFFEQTAACVPGVSPKVVANWITGELFSLLNQAGIGIDESPISASELASLILALSRGEINNTTAKTVLSEMYRSGQTADAIIKKYGWQQVSDQILIAGWVDRVLAENQEQVVVYLEGKETISRWLFGQVMRLAQGQANPQVVQTELERKLALLKR
jgi:aspartyl-tRNA(Asn)/glutamyl-tRNA(Gln) amidotransferase subunit B